MQSSDIKKYRDAKNQHVYQYVETDWHNDIQEIGEAFSKGYNQGHGLACHNTPKVGQELWLDSLGRVEVDEDNAREVHTSLCFEAESNGRCFSPWEFIAHDLNSCEDEWLTEILWVAYECGVAAAIEHDIETYNDEDYQDV